MRKLSHQNSYHSQAGITLIESIFSVAVLATLTSLSFPSFAGLIHSSEANTARDALTTSLSLARIAAASRHGEVAVCPSADQVHCDDSERWQAGWIVFQDLDHDGKRSEQETILQVSQLHKPVAILSTAGRKHVTFRDDGSATGTNLTFTLCDKRGATQAATLVINNAGRMRQGKPTDAQATSACAGL
jgi:type IV fimbrial biogenesis protein FimT